MREFYLKIGPKTIILCFDMSDKQVTKIKKKKEKDAVRRYA